MCFPLDDENDKVVISSDEELTAALLFDKRKDREPFRLYVQRNGTSGCAAPKLEEAPEEPGNYVGEIHWGVTCDGCQHRVKGFRYKCLQCADYDLCGKCETKGFHPGHPMIRVSGPLVCTNFSLHSLNYSN